MSDVLVPGRRAGGVLSYISLFTSFSTLLCCALPSLLVLIGLGATVASALTSVPWLVNLSRHKNWVFAISGLFIGANLIYVYAVAPRLQPQVCPSSVPEACASASRLSRILLWVSATIYGIGVFSAYMLGPLLMRFG